MEIVLASKNPKKIKELQAILSKDIPNINIRSLVDVGVEGDIVEDGETFEENALIKARTAYRAAGGRYIGIGDDSGLCVDALDGAPGVYSARFAGGHGDDEANNRFLLEKLKCTPDGNMGAQFVSAIACVYTDRDGNEESFTVRGEIEGKIIREARGNGGFGYDPYFYYSPLGKTFAELSAEEKNLISHRARAICALNEKLKELDIGDI
ncbi:MAG: RdgB/HAM1 family non-canonical purine NTP pyrophosphatase [Ruminococcaceae bacterium]|nr:RdgB/HAM1 family non-canonical purine NTP pyrophosphatase [Oscillospiraceae bacterium]